MKVKRLIELLKTKDPNSNVGVTSYEYASQEDSCGFDVESDIEGIKVVNDKYNDNVVRLYTTHCPDLEK